MGFDVPPDAYERFMGRFSSPLAPVFLTRAAPGLAPPARAVDVGCGPGMLTLELARLLGEDAIAAVDPSEPFVERARDRFPDADVRVAGAEELPFEDDAFDVALAQLVVQFMHDPVAGLREMARVTRPGGTVATCVWDHGGGTGPLTPYWDAAARVDADVRGESDQRGASDGDLVALTREAGLHDVRQERLGVSVTFADFEEWWTPFTYGVGTAGDHFQTLDPTDQQRLVAQLREDLGHGPFTLEASAWCAVGTA